MIEGLQANANILRFHDCSSRIPSDDAKEPKWPAPISAWRPNRPSKSFKLQAARITPIRTACGPILLCDRRDNPCADRSATFTNRERSEEHTSTPVTNAQLVCRLLLEK